MLGCGTGWPKEHRIPHTRFCRWGYGYGKDSSQPGRFRSGGGPVWAEPGGDWLPFWSPSWWHRTSESADRVCCWCPRVWSSSIDDLLRRFSSSKLCWLRLTDWPQNFFGQRSQPRTGTPRQSQPVGHRISQNGRRFHFLDLLRPFNEQILVYI